MMITFSDDPKKKILELLATRGNKPFTPKLPPKSKLIFKPKKDSVTLGIKVEF